MIMTYEKAIEDLEKIVEKLSNDKLGIEESLTLYAQGITAAKEAMGALSEFRGKIELLNKDLSELEIPVDDETDFTESDSDDDDD